MRPRSSYAPAAHKENVMRRRIQNRFQPSVENLETRNLMTIGLSSLLQSPIITPSLTTTYTAPTGSIYTAPAEDGSKVADIVLEAQLHPVIYDVPQFSSLPGAPHTLYLNFGGDYRDGWYKYGPVLNADGTWSLETEATKEIFAGGVIGGIGMKPYDTDGDVTTFSDAEKAQIHEIWARVAEDYAPFNVNVTTVDPGNLSDARTLGANGRAVMVNIGEQTGWYADNTGKLLPWTGDSSIGSFNDDAANVVYVFVDEIKKS